MTVDVKLSAEFVRQFKRLNKKYKSLAYDYASFLASIKVNPLQGTSLGGGVYKVRMPISSKGKGKSGGARVITLNVMMSKTPEEIYEVTLLTIYDKSEMATVSDSFILSLINELQA